jgi:hypothetical protein
MSGAPTFDTGLTRRSIEREMDLVAVAIRMVAGGGAPGVTVVGLEFGPAVLEGSRRAAHNARVALEALWQAEESRCDIRVHRIGEGQDAD